MSSGIPPQRLLRRGSLALTVAAVGAAVAAALRYRSTEIVGATFDRPLSDGTSHVYMYQGGGTWLTQYGVWLGIAFGLAAAAVMLAVMSRRV